MDCVVDIVQRNKTRMLIISESERINDYFKRIISLINDPLLL